uniref:Zyxin n=1 Tax=Ciona intestinalis TaxID=7719 RepID=F6U088_CIOIN
MLKFKVSNSDLFRSNYPEPKQAAKQSNYAMAGPSPVENPYAMAGPSKVTNTSPKAVSDVDKLTSQLLQGLDTGKRKKSDNIEDFNLPPPPNLDDFTFSPPSPIKSPDLPPPPPSAVPNVYSPLPPPPAPKPSSQMSKAAPPPVLPKPSKSTPLTKESKRGVNSITIQLNKPSSAPSPSPPAPTPTTAPAPEQKSAPYVPPASTRPSVGPGSRAGIPKDIKKNSEEELDFLTNNLLKNMENPRDEEFYGYCERCNGVVEGENVGCTAMDRTFHITCFTCLKCHRNLHGEQFYCVDKDPWCDKCYMNSLEKCTVCNETITDRILRATNKPYHPHCFQCVMCGKSLDGVPFTVDEKNEVHCVEDYHKKYAPRCSVCQEAIMPEKGKEETVRIVALERSFHVDCYKCEKCAVKLNSEKEGRGCFPLDGHIFCRDCNTKIIQHLSA